MNTASGKIHRNLWQTLAYWLFRGLGWDGDFRDPGLAKYVIIVSPHTSNWDFPVGFLFSRAYPFPRPHFLAKDAAFRGLLGPIARWLGGIAVDRSKNNNYVEQVAAEFERREEFVLAITPEGTRKKTPHWKSGFYYVALAAHVPLVPASIDYKKKLITYGPAFMPSGDVEADFAIIRRFYAGVQGRHPERQGEIRLRRDEQARTDSPPA